jgi:hypothetical protein
VVVKLDELDAALRCFRENPGETTYHDAVRTQRLEECVYGGVELIGNPPCGLIWECDAHCFYDLFQWRVANEFDSTIYAFLKRRLVPSYQSAVVVKLDELDDIHVFRSGKFPD